MPFKYKPGVSSELARHGVIPSDTTEPDTVRAFINEMYLYEIRQLRKRMLAGEFPKREYAARVEALRNRYPILGLPIEFWTE